MQDRFPIRRGSMLGAVAMVASVFGFLVYVLVHPEILSDERGTVRTLKLLLPVAVVVGGLLVLYLMRILVRGAVVLDEASVSIPTAGLVKARVVEFADIESAVKEHSFGALGVSLRMVDGRHANIPVGSLRDPDGFLSAFEHRSGVTVG